MPQLRERARINGRVHSGLISRGKTVRGRAMGEAAECDKRLNFDRPNGLWPLRQVRRAQCAFPRRERAGTRAAKRDLAARRDEPKCGAQERRLPRPVRAEQSNDLAAAYFKRNVLEHLNSTEVRAD